MSTSASEYFEISTQIFLSMKGQLPFEVYVLIGNDKYTKIFNKNDTIDHTRFKSYLDKGAQKLYVLRSERRQYISATEIFIRNLALQSQIDSMDAHRAVEELAEQSMTEIYEDGIFDEENLRIATDLVRTYLHYVKKDLRVLIQFLQMCKNETYMVRHSIATAVFSVLIAKTGGNDSDRILQIVGLGALLHDIGMSQLDPKMNELNRELTEEEWAQMVQHPSLGARVAQGLPDFPPEVVQVIEQHHESYDGRGYPKGLKGEEIYYPARVVMIADCFSALTTKRGGRSLYLPQNALTLMMTESRRYDPRILASFEKLLSPKRKAAA
ncbi:MAG: HD domain-containing protein [Oligoflexia bacterium]|nr:HD domain-containing protein [Oligoflexia bacterium]